MPHACDVHVNHRQTSANATKIGTRHHDAACESACKLASIFLTACRKFAEIYTMKKEPDKRAFVLRYAREHSSFSIDELLEAVSVRMETSRSGLRWVLHKVAKDGYLERVRRGVYKRRTKLPFVPLLRQNVRKLRRELLTRFQTMPFIVYGSEYFSKLQEHPVPNKLLYLEVPRNRMDDVFVHLLKMGYDAQITPDETAHAQMRSSSAGGVVVLPLHSQSPFQWVDGVPTPRMEKLLVDLYAESVFGYLRGREYSEIFRNACSQYSIREDTMLRYAGRRHARAAIEGELFNARSKSKQ